MKIAILGRQARISLAELVSLYGHRVQAHGSSAALIDADKIDLNRLGGTIKVGRVIAQIRAPNWNKLTSILPDQIDWQAHFNAKSKFSLGLSVYGLFVSDQQIMAFGLELKKLWRHHFSTGFRFIPSKNGTLNAASVTHNKLLQSGADLIITLSGQDWIVAITEQVQDIDNYAARDFARPTRNPKIGMLPPKLAQILLNLTNPPPGATILDPFCGTGGLLQEAMIMGWPVLGSDINPDQVAATAENLSWLSANRPLASQARVIVADATTAIWPETPGAVTSELDLGPALTGTQTKDRISPFKSRALSLTQSFLANLSGQIPEQTPVGLAIPVWRVNDQFVRLGVIDLVSPLGYTIRQFEPVQQRELIYWRPGQLVGRELLVLIKAANNGPQKSRRHH